MSKFSSLIILIGLLALSSCGMEPLNKAGDQYDAGTIEPMVTSTSNVYFGIYTESVPLKVNWDIDTKLDVWNGMTIVEQTNYRHDGVKSWKFTGTGTWMGLGIRVNPITTVKSMSAFSGGYVRFSFKGTKTFKIGIKNGGTAPVEKWISMTNGRYGFYTNNAWCAVTIPLSVFAGVDLSKIEQYFMWAADASFKYTVGSVYYIDNIFWYKTVTYTVSSSSSVSSVISSSSSSKVSSSVSSVISSSSSSKVSSSVSSVISSSSSSKVSSSSSSVSSTGFDTNLALVLYSDTLKQNVVWPTDINTNESPSDPNLIEFTTATAGEGAHSFHIHVNSNMFNVNWLRFPLVTYLDLTPYKNGTLRMMIKAPKSISVSIHMVENYDIMVHLTNGMYGFKTNNTWCSVVIPMSYWAGMDLTRLYGWLKFYGGYYEGITGGEDYYIDNVYFYKQ